MKSGISDLTVGIGLLTGTLSAYGQAPSPTLVAEVPVPPSGVLSTQQPAPVPVPPSGVLVTPPTIERHAVTTVPVKTAKTVQIAKRTAPATMRRHFVRKRFAAQRETMTRTATKDQTIAATSSVVSTSGEEPRNDGISYQLFLYPLGKAKEAK